MPVEGRRHGRRKVEMHGPARWCLARAIALATTAAGAFGLDLEAGLHQGAQQRRVVEDLVGVAAADAALDHAGDHQQRRTLLRGIGDAVDRVGEARAQGRHQETRCAGHGAAPAAMMAAAVS